MTTTLLLSNFIKASLAAIDELHALNRRVGIPEGFALASDSLASTDKSSTLWVSPTQRN